MLSRKILFPVAFGLLIAPFLGACGGHEAPEMRSAWAALGLSWTAPGIAHGQPPASPLGQSHITVTGTNPGDVTPILTGGGYINVENNGAHVAVTLTGSGTINVINNGGVLTATNTGDGVMTIHSTATAAVTVTNTGDGQINVEAAGTDAVTFTHDGPGDAVYPIPAPPQNAAQSILFSDLDAVTGKIAGNLTITKALSESDIAGYVLYWGSDAHTKLGLSIADFNKTGFDITHTFAPFTLIPIGATHFLVFTRNSEGEMSTATCLMVRDVLTIISSALATPSEFAAVGFGWDWDMQGPEDSSAGGGAPDPDFDFGNGSFYSNVLGGSSTIRKYTSFRFYPQAIFGGVGVTVGDIQTLSYWTKQKTPDGIVGSIAAANRTWQLKIYTVNPAAATTPALWFKKRMNSQLQYYTDNSWKKNTTDSNLKFVDSQSIYDKINNVNIPYTTVGSHSGTLADLRTDYGAESILFIDIIAGSSTPAPVIESYLDGLVIELTNGKKAVIDLQ